MSQTIALERESRLNAASSLPRRKMIDRWIGAQKPDASILSNVASGELPFQRWFHFKEAFSPRFVAETLRSLPYRVERCLDPFAGSGTTSLTCRMLGISSTSIELNPFLADVALAKLAPVSPSRFRADYGRLITKLKVTEGDYRVPSGMPATLVEPGRNGRYVFSASVYATARAILRRAHRLEPDTARLLRVLLGSVLVENSNVTINGKGRRYRSNWEARPKTSNDLVDSLDAAVDRAADDLLSFAGLSKGLHKVYNQDARTQLRRLKRTDTVIFSPPYPNSFDYTDVYNLELWVLGYLKTTKDNTSLRRNTLRSHVQTKWSARSSKACSAHLDETVFDLESRRDHLWNRFIPQMIQYYFDDLFEVFEGIRKLLPKGHYVVVAIGDSQYAGVLVDVPAILSEVVEPLGFKAIERRAIRSMRNSSQHGGRHELSETAIVFERVA